MKRRARRLGQRKESGGPPRASGLARRLSSSLSNLRQAAHRTSDASADVTLDAKIPFEVTTEATQDSNDSIDEEYYNDQALTVYDAGERRKIGESIHVFGKFSSRHK